MSRRAAIAIASCILMLFCANQAWAQNQTRKSADDYIREFVSGQNRDALRLTMWPCPASDSLRNEVFTRLLALPQDGMRVQLYGEYWIGALRDCDEPRLQNWFRETIGSTEDAFAVLTLGVGLGRRGGREDLIALRNALYRSSISEEIRAELWSVTRSVPLPEKIKWLADGFAEGRSIPFKALFSPFLYTLSGQDKAAARMQLANALKSRPAHPRAVTLISILAADAMELPDQHAWRGGLTAVFREVASRQDVPANTREVAEAATMQLTRSR